MLAFLLRETHLLVFLQSQNATWGHFMVKRHVFIKNQALPDPQILRPVGIPLLRCIRRKAIYSILQSRYCQGTAP